MTKRQWSPRSLKLPEITFLAEKIEALPERERLYARSLIAQAMWRGTLSDKQLRAVARHAKADRETRRGAHRISEGATELSPDRPDAHCGFSVRVP